MKSNRTVRLGDSLKSLSVCCKRLPEISPFFPASEEDTITIIPSLLFFLSWILLDMLLNREGMVTGQAREISHKCPVRKLSLSTPDDLEAKRIKKKSWIQAVSDVAIDFAMRRVCRHTTYDKSIQRHVRILKHSWYSKCISTQSDGWQ